MGHNVAVALIVDMRFWPSDGKFSLSGDQCRSLMLGFDSQGEPVRLGAVVTTVGYKPLVPGTMHRAVKVQMWADYPSELSEVGTAFSIWYGEDVGTGTVVGTEPDE
jgi:hypothetical protein